jgi:hypothetical protein
MTYKDKFSASEQKAHSRLIATKIRQEMSKLRAGVEVSPTTPKRWIWELIQNAKDVNVGGKVRVRVEADLDGPNAHVTFSHNGAAFSAENIRFLIEQVSSKDRTTDSTGRPTSTGKFGTGFLTTHLLSEKVLVTGVVKEDGLLPRKFDLSLDRSGGDSQEIIASVEAAKILMGDLDNRPPVRGYADGNFNTSFRYELTDKTGKKVASAGLKDLDICIPYTLAFVREIESVEYANRLVNLEQPPVETDGEVQFFSAKTTDAKGGSETYSIAVLSRGLTAIAVPVEHLKDGVRILQLDAEVPRLFCDFPLLGTESIQFPVIINNPTFNPTEPRDGVFLTRSERSEAQSDQNRIIIKEALALYLELLDFASRDNWQGLHLLAVAKPLPSFPWADPEWFETEILKPMQTALLRAKIVRTATGTLASIHSPDGKNNIWFPSNTSKAIRHRIWSCCKEWFPDNLPAQLDIDFWHETIWPECNKLTLDQIAEWMENYGTLEEVSSHVSGGKKVHEWFNEFYATLQLDELAFQAVFKSRLIFPNQNGTLKKKAELFQDAGDIDPALLEILKLLGSDLRDHLLDSKIVTDLDDLSEKDGNFVVNEITSKVNKLIADRDALDRYRPAVSQLLIWFHENPTKAKKLFGILHEQKHRLYDDEEILANIKDADQLKELLKHYNVTTVEELHTAIEKQTGGSKLLPVTQQIIASLGITSIEEWTKALEDKNLATLFSHESTPTPDMFIFAQSLIQKAKEQVIAHLSKLKEYDLTDLDETAVTVLAGIKKAGRDVTIVVRPAYDGTVIIYYQSERDVLDFVDHELWVDMGSAVRRITFGHILKKTGIRRFPI